MNYRVLDLLFGSKVRVAHSSVASTDGAVGIHGYHSGLLGIGGALVALKAAAGVGALGRGVFVTAIGTNRAVHGVGGAHVSVVLDVVVAADLTGEAGVAGAIAQVPLKDEVTRVALVLVEASLVHHGLPPVLIQALKVYILQVGHGDVLHVVVILVALLAPYGIGVGPQGDGLHYRLPRWRGRGRLDRVGPSLWQVNGCSDVALLLLAGATAQAPDDEACGKGNYDGE